jgi:hypothetical protein
VSLRFSRGNPVCKHCNSGALIREYTEAQLYNQLCYFQFMFHFEKATMGITPAAKGTASSRELPLPCVLFSMWRLEMIKSYFFHWFQARLTRILAENPDLHATLSKLSDHMERIIRSNAYSIVNLAELFAKAIPRRRE